MKPDYQKNGVTLYCADCRDVLPTLGKVDAVVTDPPYGMQRFETDGKDYLEIVGPALRTAWERVKDDGNVFVFTSTAEVIEVANALGQRLKRMFWMYKPADCTYPLAGWLLTSEAILWFQKGNKITLACRRPFKHDCYIHTRSGLEGVEGHPTVKPIEVVRDFIAQIPEGETILDPFMGSGTTGVACVRLGRKFIGIEIEPKYFEIAVRRIESAFDETSLLDHAAAQQAELAL